MGTVGVILPAFRQPNLLTEAILDVIRQKTSFELKFFVVDDACDFDETQRISQSLGLIDPRILICSRRSNGGLSANRNTGIAYALATCPDLEAITFLDADDRLDQGTLQWFYDRLRSAPEPAPGKKVGWVYTDPYQFGGIFSYLQKPDEYSPLWHLLANSNSATSLVSIEMLRAGCRFDEGMRRGSEDWDFWLQGIRNDFYGLFVRPPTFRYRRRPESMTSDAKLYNLGIRAYVAERNADLYSESYIQKVAAHDALRYAWFDAADPGNPKLLYFLNKTGRWGSGFDAFLRASAPDRRNEVTFSPTIIVVESKENGRSAISPFIRDDIFAMAERAMAGHPVVTVRCDAADQQAYSVETTRKLRLSALLREKSGVAMIFMRAETFVSIGGRPDHEVEIELLEISIAPGMIGQPREGRACEIELAHIIDRASDAGLHRKFAFQYHPKWVPLGVASSKVVNFLCDADVLPASCVDGDHAVLALDPRLLESPLQRAQLEALASKIREHASLTIVARTDYVAAAAIADLERLGDRLMTFPPALIGSEAPLTHYMGAPINIRMVEGNDRAVAGAMLGAKLFVIAGFPEMFGNAFMRRKKGAKVWALNLGEDDPVDGRGLHRSLLGHAVAYEHALDMYFVPDGRAQARAAGQGMPRDKLALLADSVAHVDCAFADDEARS